MPQKMPFSKDDYFRFLDDQLNTEASPILSGPGQGVDLLSKLRESIGRRQALGLSGRRNLSSSPLLKVREGMPRG